jgi:hypothetical protein
MSRYTSELAVTKTPEQVGETTSQFRMKEGFALKDYADGEKVWQKGNVYLDEMNLSGFFGWAVKKMLKDRVTVLEQQLGA